MCLRRVCPRPCSAEIVWLLSGEQLKERQRDWEAEGRLLASAQLIWKQEKGRLERERAELARAFKRLPAARKA